MSGVKTLVLIESDKLRNLQENLKSVHDLSEKYEDLKEQYDNQQGQNCTSCKNSKNIQENEKNISRKNHQDKLSATETNYGLQEQVSKEIDNKESEMRPNPEVSPVSYDKTETNWFCVL